MVTKGFRYEFTPRELWYKLFKPKVCPICGNKLTKHKTHEIRTGKDAERTRNDAFFTENAEVKYYIYYYDCAQCNKRYSLSELASKDKK